MRGTLLVALSLVGTLGACRRRPPPPEIGAATIEASTVVAPLPTARPEGTWTGTTLAFRGHPFAVSVRYELDRATVGFTGFPAGTSVAVADQPAAVNDRGDASVIVDVGESYGALAIERAFEPSADVPVDKRLSIRFPNGVVFEDKLPSIPTFDVKTFDLLARANEHEIHLSPAGARSHPRSILLLHWNAQGRVVVGPAKTLAEIDWVAVKDESDTIRTGRRCAGYGVGADAKTYTLEMVDQTWNVIDISSKRVVATRVFRGPDRCPEIASNGHATSYPNDDERRSWLRSVRTIRAKR